MTGSPSRSLLVAALCAVAAAGCSGGGEETVPSARGPALFLLEPYFTPKDGGFEASRLVRIDKRTLRPRGRPLPLGDAAYGPVASPDRRLIALGGVNYRQLILVDPARLRVAGAVERVALPEHEVVPIAWPRRDRIFALVYQFGKLVSHRESLAIVDPIAGRGVARRRLDGVTIGWGETRQGAIAVLLEARHAILPARVAVLTVDGRFREVRLQHVRAGSASPDGALIIQREPGFAVDPVRERAYVVGAGEPVAEVDLRTLTVRYHRVPGLVSPSEHRFAEPPQQAGSAGPYRGPQRQARWLGGGAVAVTGQNSFYAPGRWATISAPAGLTVLDVRRWRARAIDRRADAVEYAAGLLLTTRTRVAKEGSTGDGVRAYDRHGRQRFHLLRGKPAGVRVLGARAYLGVEGSDSYRVVALPSGRILRTVRAPRFSPSLAFVWVPPPRE